MESLLKQKSSKILSAYAILLQASLSNSYKICKLYESNQLLADQNNCRLKVDM